MTRGLRDDESMGGGDSLPTGIVGSTYCIHATTLTPMYVVGSRMHPYIHTLTPACAQELDQHAFKFKKSSRGLSRMMWWKNIKLIILLVLVIAAIFYAILASACGGADLPNC